MSHVNRHHSSHHLLAGLQRFDFGGLSAFASKLAKRRRDRRELKQVLSMSDHMLKDIGVTRGQIERELSERLS